jgi:hypothetical protein
VHIKMSLSRHFYSLDEVQAALIFSASRNNQKETLFWCQELLSSGLVAETISTLFESWLFHTGVFRLQWLLDSWASLASDELTESDILLAASRLSSINYSRRDNSLWNILVLTGCEPDRQPDRVTPKTPIGARDTFEGIDLYFVRAVYQGKAQSAWWATQYMSVSRVWEILRWFAENVFSEYTEKYLACLRAFEGYEALLGFRSDEYDIIIRCAAVLAFCISQSARVESFKPFAAKLGGDEIMFLGELKALEGRKGARMFSVPVLCLYGVTGRGRSQWSQQNFVKLNNVEKYMRGCAFWDEAVAEFAADGEDEIKWPSDDAYEAFYSRYFPDDIPDEWSRAEKLKSHGDGVLGPTEKLSLVKYTRTHYGKLCRLAWNTRELVFKQLQKLNETCNYDCNIVNAVGGFKFSVNRPIHKEIKLEPVHKRRISASSSS